MLTIGGQGFSSNLFDGSNEVLLSGDGYTLPCDVIDYSSSSQQIICTTRYVHVHASACDYACSSSFAAAPLP